MRFEYIPEYQKKQIEKLFWNTLDISDSQIAKKLNIRMLTVRAYTSYLADKQKEDFKKGLMEIEPIKKNPKIEDYVLIESRLNKQKDEVMPDLEDIDKEQIYANYKFEQLQKQLVEQLQYDKLCI